MEITIRSYTCLTLALLLSGGGIGRAVAQTNTAVGQGALASLSTGTDNSAFGYQSLTLTTWGAYNTAVGSSTLKANTSGSGNTAIGWRALESNKTGDSNTASGIYALDANTTGIGNTASGSYALIANTTGGSNTASGDSALGANTTGNGNTASGFDTLSGNSTGNYNTSSGFRALFLNSTGSYNIAIGYQSGYFAVGSHNIEIGNTGRAADTGVIRIGTQGTQRFTQIAGISGVNVTGGVPVLVNSKGQLGVVSSSRRYKEDIRSMGDTSDRLLKLHPVTFRYKQPDESGQKPQQYGLIAEEVAKVMPELVIYNDKGQPETVAYQTLTPLLLNELQREHTQFQTEVDALRAEVAELRRAIRK